MRTRFLLTLLAVATLAACNSDATSYSGYDLLGSFTLNGGFAYGVEGGLPGRGLPEMRRLSQLPDSIKLTSEQETRINALLEAFQTANKADLDALSALHDQAHAARDSGKTREEVEAILKSGDAIRTRLETALRQLRTDIDAVLTTEQKAWLATHQYQRCDPSSAPALTDAQKAQIQALRDAFQTANQADLDAVKAAMDAAHAARAAGKTHAEVDAIMAGVKDAMDRLHAAGETLRTQIDALLTPEQKAAACFGRGFGMGGPGMGGRGMPGPEGMGGRGGMGGGRHAPPGW